ncbi:MULTISPECIES: hypothetical protein [unclassified Ancylobacter]|jgi:hypothetical protein|uniref:hypothetical protein n=1 Tax=unclassified Ancylobacter TaxID=2626613 RepID=UPI002271A69D|nr:MULTISPECIES: hypothetical protein [unclassified Ancylobacter]WAC25516.1 hypothetical protein OU996_10700 [Ancylobacter sp. SL191]WGD32102.1 hypothetical protein AncyloWKF20_09900 [Ancylobacter sp. WKF20]
MSISPPEGQLIPEIGVIETTESDNVLHWDGDELYVEQDVYHNGQLVHRKYRRRVTKQVAQAIARMLAQH